MNGRNIVLDTNILLYFLDGDKNVRHFFTEYNPIISFITELELLSSPEITTDEKILIKELISNLTIVNYSDVYKSDILKVRSLKKLKLPDAIIASLAISLDIAFVTADKALRNIKGLDLVFFEMPNQS